MILDTLRPWRAHVDEALASALPAAAPPRLRASMAYALLSPGKRMRPLLVLASARAASGMGDAELLPRALPAAVAIEMVHAYSLIHDDLPAMDDDALRRGRPTVHIEFDEPTAILAGDALLTEAFSILATAPQNAARQVAELAKAAGALGMVGGQMMDIEAEGTAIDVDRLMQIHAGKTGALLAAACALGASAVDADPTPYRTFGAHLGLCFQIADDVLDVVGDEKARGKVSGNDAAREKLTYVRAFGLAGAKARAQKVLRQALACTDDATLQALARFAANREL